jgi:DNA-binding CsgD family transcriptional regulator
VIVRPVLCKPFVGRREELAFLHERRREAGASHGGLTLVAGDAGVGKSRLLSEFCLSLSSSKWRIGTGACLAFASRPYGPLLDVLARVDSHPFDLGSAASKIDQFDAIVARIAAIAARSALAIAIEDIHWADAATLDLLTYLGPKLARMRVLVVVTYRTDGLPLDHPIGVAIGKMMRGARAERIELAPLCGVELRTFIDEALAGIHLPDDTRRAIALTGDGNPFFTEELLKSAVEDAGSPDRASSRHLPPTVRATLLERLAPFDAEERRVVSQAAFIGRTFRLPLLAATLAADPDALLPTLRRARDYQLIEEVSPSVFRFRHGLTREAIYGDFLGAEARPRHRAIAEVLERANEADRSLEALAYHWWAAGEPVQSARYNEEAGDAAVAVHAHEDALFFYERALEATGLLPLARGTLFEKIGERNVALAATDVARVAFERAANAFFAAGAFEREATARVVGAQTAYVLELREPTAALEAMLARLDAEEHLAVSRVSLGLAWITASQWFPDLATRYLERVDAGDLAKHGDIRLRYHNVAAWVAMTVGDLAVFRREHAAWLAAAGDVGSTRAVAGAHYNGAMCLGFFGYHDEALAMCDRAFTMTREARLRQGEESTHATATMIQLFRGDLATAWAHARAVASTNDRVSAALTSVWATLVAVARDDRSAIATLFDGREADQLASPEFDRASAYAELFVRRGRTRDAVTLLDRVSTDGDVIRGSFHTLLAMGKHGSATARARGRALLARAADVPAPSPERYALALFDARVARDAGYHDESLKLARVAAEGFRAIRFPLLEAEALEVAGDPLNALALYERCGAAYDVRRLRPPSAAPEGDPARDRLEAISVLSAREREIAILAGAGKSNLQIANELSITQKTVEKHISSIYAKLGVGSRFDLRVLVSA